MFSWDILTHPNSQLRERSQEVDVARITTPEFQKFADNFGAFMVASDGVGLAAPQIGIRERIIAVQPSPRDPIAVYINPEIIKASAAMQDSEEGCLSVPGVYGMVDRHKRITVRATNRHGRQVEMDLSGFPAIVFQHEIDHLDGILFIDKMKKTVKNGTGVNV